MTKEEILKSVEEACGEAFKAGYRKAYMDYMIHGIAKIENPGLDPEFIKGTLKSKEEMDKGEVEDYVFDKDE